MNVLVEFMHKRKQAERRGFPPGQKRYGPQTRLELLTGEDGKSFWARLPRRQSKTFGRTFDARIELIKREIDAMTDYEQSVLIRQSPDVFLKMFRPDARVIVENYAKLRDAWERGERPAVLFIPPRPRS
jgi:hypothetical protein